MGEQQFRSLFQGAIWAQAPAARCAVLQDQRAICFALDDRPCYAEVPALAGAKEIWESDSGTEFVLCARFEDGSVRCPFKPKRNSVAPVFAALEAERSPRDVVLLRDTEMLIVRADGSLFAPTEPLNVPVPSPAPPAVAELGRVFKGR